MKRRQITRGVFLRGAAAAAGAAMAAGQAGAALAQAVPEGLSSGRPIRGRLVASRGGRTAQYQFDYPGNEAVYTVEMVMTPESVFDLAGFKVYNPGGSVHVSGGAQRGLVPNVVANVVSRQKGRFTVQVYNYSSEQSVDYQLRVVAGVPEGQKQGAAAPSLDVARSAALTVYVGTYTEPATRKGQGVEVFHMDPTNGTWAPLQTAKGVRNPSFLALDPQQHFLYAVEEVNDFDAKKSGAVSAFAIDQHDGSLVWLNRQSSGGAHPAHLSVDPTGRFVLVANYTGGSVEVLPIQDDGSLGAPTDLVQHSADLGLGPNKARQEAPHPHMIPFDPGGRFVLVPDLGLDRTFVYRLSGGKLVPGEFPFAMASKAGSGPRHVAFHPVGNVVYVINELSSTIDVFSFDPGRGAMQLWQTVSTLPADFKETNGTAEIVVAPSGQFLYGSNRGHDSIVIFAIDQTNGALSIVGWESTQGKTPRNINIDPTGSYLYAANQDSSTVTGYSIDQATGKLSAFGQGQIGTPVDMVFAT
jgi:6-phosphogluconolactonase